MAPDQPAVMSETHISWVLLTGEHAYKIHKPVRTEFLDRRTLADRRRACEEEVELNARLAPDVYRGVGAISLGAEELEPVIVMRRMPTERRLTALLPTAEARSRLREVAGVVAGFHDRTAVADDAMARDVATAAAFRRRWDEDLSDVRAAATGEGVDDLLAEIEGLAHGYVAGRDALFDERIAGGMVRDGHGDLLAQDIFCLDDGPRILDCLAFDPRLRTVDVVADVAFLVMDLEHLGHCDLALAFMQDYGELSGEHHPASLAHFHVAQRALVRAKVAAIRHTQEEAAGTETRAFLDQSLDHLRRAEVRLVLVGGIPGSGKSTVAGQLHAEYGWTLLSTDEIRHDLRLRRSDIGDKAYEPDTVGVVYERMLERAGHLLRAGHTVVLDATWTSAGPREAARAVAADRHARMIELRCDAPRSVCRERILRRRDGDTESEATTRTVDLLVERADDWPEAMTVDTSGSTDRPAIGLAEAAAWLRTEGPGER